MFESPRELLDRPLVAQQAGRTVLQIRSLSQLCDETTKLCLLFTHGTERRLANLGGPNTQTNKGHRLSDDVACEAVSARLNSTFFCWPPRTFHFFLPPPSPPFPTTRNPSLDELELKPVLSARRALVRLQCRLPSQMTCHYHQATYLCLKPDYLH